jgi:hypothetical protein
MSWDYITKCNNMHGATVKIINDGNFGAVR